MVNIGMEKNMEGGILNLEIIKLMILLKCNYISLILGLVENMIMKERRKENGLNNLRITESNELSKLLT